MAQAAANVNIGRALVYVAPWVTAGGAGTFVEAGHTKTPFEWQPNITVYDSKSEQAKGPILSVITESGHTIKFAAMESRPDLLALALGLASGQITGTYPNQTVQIDDPGDTPLEYQIKIETRGPGTTKLRTVTYWRCALVSVEPIQFGKGVEQVYNVTLRVLRDDSVATGKNARQIDA